MSDRRQTFFYCEMCRKKYFRAPEYNSHLSSYEHAHQKRRMDLQRAFRRSTVDDPISRKQRELETTGITSVKETKLSSAPYSEPKKKGFKKAFSGQSTSIASKANDNLYNPWYPTDK